LQVSKSNLTFLHDVEELVEVEGDVVGFLPQRLGWGWQRRLCTGSVAMP
jgi:hypothetical protein